MDRPKRKRCSLGDRAVVVAGILAVVVVTLFGATPDERPQPRPRTAQSAHR
jgi:hypothetical protein